MSAHDIAERAVERGGEGTVALVQVSSEADLRWANSMLTTNGERVSTSLTVAAFSPVSGGTAVGVASGPVRSPQDVDDLVARARATSAAGEAAPDAMPLVSGIAPSSSWADEVEGTSGAAFADLAPQLGEAFAAGRADGIEHFGYAEHSVVTTFLASSSGLRQRHTQHTARVEATAKSHSRTRSAWAGRAARDLQGMAFDSVDAELRQGLEWQGRPVTVEPGRHDVILSPSAVADLMVYLLWTSSARDAADGRTVFSSAGGTRLGEQLTEAPLTLSGDPADAELACRAFDATPWGSSLSSAFDLGLPLSRTAWIENGSLQHLISTRHVAGELGVDPTPMIDNLRLTHATGSGSLTDVVARSGRAILITCLWYIREVDPRTLLLTGLTRDGVYLVENGEVVGSAGNYRFNMSPVDVLGLVRDAGATAPTLPREWADYFTRAATPPLLVADFNLSTRSDAL